MTGLFTKPIEEAQKGGALGFMRGVGKGVIGVAVKPVIGVTDGITHMAQGISNELSDTVEKKHLRPPRAFHRSKADPTELILSKLDLTAAFSQSFVLKNAKKNDIKDSFVDMVILDKSTESRVIISECYLFWIISRERLWSRSWSSVSHCMFLPGQSVGIIVYDRSGKKDTVPITCSDNAVACRLYRALARNSFRMGNPGAIIDADIVFGRKNETKKGIRDVLNDYDFGSANTEAPIDLPAGSPCNSVEVLRRTTERLHFVSTEDWATLDRVCWSMIQEWDRGHRGLRATRCCLLLVINKSNEVIHLNRSQLKEGKSIHYLPGEGYSEVSKTVDLGGYVVIFGVATGSTTGIDYGNVTFSLSTSAADIVVSSQLSLSECENLHGSHGGFREKSVSEWWSKYVVCITN